MTAQTKKTGRTRAIIVYIVLGLWCLACAGLGILALGQPYAPVPFVIAGLSAVVLLISGLMRSLIGAVYGVILITAFGIVAGGALSDDWIVVGIGLLAAAIAGCSVPIVFALHDLAEREGSAAAALPQDLRDTLQQIHEHSMLSDSAKRVLFREREMDLLRAAIEADIAEGKYNVALTLCDEMADVFGHRNEAETFRSRIMQARQQRFDADVRAAMDQLDGLLRARDWAAVHQEASRIRRLYHDSHLVQNLDQRILQARAEHKHELEVQFLQAAQRDDVEAAMNLLKELDRYLEPAEAERLAEVAQGVVVKHRDNLGVQFKLAVNDRRWAEAARIGETIITEFPNTKMADEVRSMIDLLRTRATQAALVEGAGR
ncbi:MAG: hypothetical protein SYC29_03365 [Planctomycetota bacterium]|nr:hypothetical protein [Planctomycetota bacterium]